MNWLVILGVSVVGIVLAMIWFWPLFWKMWLKIHGWENKTKQELKQQEEGMGKLLAIEGVNTIIMVTVLSFLLQNISGYSPYLIGFLLWLWFIYPIIFSCIVWWADKKEYWYTKITILAVFNLVIVMLASFLLTTFS